MLVCHCSMAGTAACRNCSRFIEYYGHGTSNVSTTVAWYTTPPKIETTPRCDCCKYYHKEGESKANPDLNYGDCRRNAPVLTKPNPRVKGDYWCGEYAEAP